MNCGHESAKHLVRECPATPAGPLKRNLIYHIWPNLKNSAWRDNLRSLRTRLGQFNGRQIISVATGPGAATLDQVQAALDVPDIEWIEVPNDPDVGERVSFGRMLEMVRSTDPNEISFYGHAKGTSYFDGHKHAEPAKRWRNVMYHACLDDPANVDRVLSNHDACGCYLSEVPQVLDDPKLAELSAVPFHFSGTFFWVRHSAVFTDKRWSSIPWDFYATESWPGRVCKSYRVASLWQPRPSSDPGNPYLHDMHPVLSPRPEAEPSFSVVMRCKGRLRYLRESLPLWFQQGSPAREVILVDYDDPEHSGDWAEEWDAERRRRRDAGTRPSLAVVRVTHPPQAWNHSHSRNCGTVRAAGDYLVFADAEFLPARDYLSRAVAAIRSGHELWIQATTGERAGGLPHRMIAEAGTCVVSAAACRAVRGYDESHTGYGYEDLDFYRRVIRQCKAVIGYDFAWRAHDHDHAIRVEHTADLSYQAAIMRNGKWYERAKAHPDRVVNPAGYGRF